MSRPLIEFPVYRPVAANLLMFVLIVAGGLGLAQMRQEYMPELPLPVVEVEVAYPGAGAEEIESGLLLPIENAVRRVDGLKRVTSEARDDGGRVSVRLEDSVDRNTGLQAVKNAVDGLTDLPLAAERPQVRLASETFSTMTLMVYGPQSPLMLRDLANQVCAELRECEGVSRVELLQRLPAEISIEVSEACLREQGLELDGIAAHVATSARSLSGGILRGSSSEYVLQSGTRRETAGAFANVPVVTGGGGVVPLSSIASIVASQGTVPVEMTYNGDPAVGIVVYRVADETPAGIARAVDRYLARLRPSLPPGTGILIQENDAAAYDQRVSLLINDAWQGLVLVLVVLGLFFETRLAIWVMLGIPTAVLGGVALLPSLDVTVNMISLAALILTFGIIADDAIMVGEAVWCRREKGESPLAAALHGLGEMKGLVLLVVGTNVIGFAPMLLIDGAYGPLFRQVGLVVILTFVASMVEALFIFPAHVAHAGPGGRWFLFLNAPQRFMNRVLARWMERTYRPLVRQAIGHPFWGGMAAVGVVALTVALLAGGHLRFNFEPAIDADAVSADAQLPYGCSPEQSRRVRDHLVAAARRVIDGQGGASLAEGVTCTIGMVAGADADEGEGGYGNHLVGVMVQLAPLAGRVLTGAQFAEAWRAEAGMVAGTEAVRFRGTEATAGDEDLVLELRHPEPKRAWDVAEELAAQLRRVPGVLAVDTGAGRRRPEFAWQPRPAAERLGLTADALGTQLRHRFHGAEAVRFQRGTDEVRVMVRLPRAERESLAALEAMQVVLPDGSRLPLTEAAELAVGQAPLSIQRADGVRIVPLRVVLAPETDDAVIDRLLEEELLPAAVENHPGLSWTIGGEAREVDDALTSLLRGGLIAAVVLYAILAIWFNSYAQPVLVMSVIPIGAAGAFWGHFLLRCDVSIMSLVGLVAMAGLVVNESVVLVSAANDFQRDGHSWPEAALEAAVQRFRPVFLTSMTTIGGLLPLLAERSGQGQFIAPMAISMCFGQAFAMFAVLLVLPNLHVLTMRGRSRGVRDPETCLDRESARTIPVLAEQR